MLLTTILMVGCTRQNEESNPNLFDNSLESRSILCTPDWSLELVPDMTGDVCPEIKVTFTQELGNNTCTDCDVLTLASFSARSYGVQDQDEQQILEYKVVDQSIRRTLFEDIDFEIIHSSIKFTSYINQENLSIGSMSFIIMGDTDYQPIEICVTIQCDELGSNVGVDETHCQSIMALCE